MGFSGDLRTVELAEILQWIAGGRRTGTLVVSRGPVEKRIAFARGLIAFSHSNDPRDQMGQYLVREGYVDEQELFTALLRQESEGKLLGAVLLESGKMSEEQLLRALRMKSEETIYDLFLWEEGRFEFREDMPPRGVPVLLELDVTPLIFEGARRVDELSRIREVIPSPRSTFRQLGGSAESAPDDPVLELAARGKTLAAIALELRRSEFDVASRLFELVERGVLAVEAEGASRTEASTVGAIKTLLERARRAERERRFDDAAAAYDSLLLLDALNQHAKKGLLELEAKRAQPQPPPAATLEAVPRLARDLTALVAERLEPIEGFMLSRINGRWTVRSILKLCPLPEQEAWRVFERLRARGLILL